MQAGPDGSDLWQIAATITANQASANQVQLFQSPDGGTTFNFMPLSALLAAGNIAQTTQATTANFVMPNTVPMGPTNPLIIGGRGLPFTYPTTNSVQTESTLYFTCQFSTTGTTAQVCANCYNASGTQLGASPATGTIVDFQAGGTTSGATTVAFGLQSATSIKRTSAVALSSGDITTGFVYRAIYDGTEWILLLTDRIYAAIGQSQASTVSVWGAHR